MAYIRRRRPGSPFWLQTGAPKRRDNRHFPEVVLQPVGKRLVEVGVVNLRTSGSGLPGLADDHLFRFVSPFLMSA
jgi:hypothetical protein